MNKRNFFKWWGVMELDYVAIGKRIRNERKKKGLNQMRLAELSGLSLNTISHIECGNTKFSLPSIVAIANALNVTVDCFLMDVVDNSLIQFKRELVEIFHDCSKEEYILLSDICKQHFRPLEIYKKIEYHTMKIGNVQGENNYRFFLYTGKPRFF